LKLTTFIILFFPLAVFSQQPSNTFHLLFAAGVSPSQVHGDAYSGFHKLGAIGGVGIEVVPSEKWSSSLSFWFIQKGARKNQNTEKNDLTYYYLNMNYLEVPLMVVYKQKKFLFDAGVSAGYLINYYEGSEAGNITGLYPFKKFEYSVKIGLGYAISPKWSVNLRSSNSFITTRPNRTKQAIYFNNIIARTFNKGYYNNILEFTLTYRLKTKKTE
jgi:hypothetical protein